MSACYCVYCDNIIDMDFDLEAIETAQGVKCSRCQEADENELTLQAAMAAGEDE